MEILSIGKPAINVYLPLQEFPQEGDIFTIKKKIESVGNVSATAACILGKWKMNSHFTGVVGNDGYADKIRLVFTECDVNTRYLETQYESSTATNYIVLNSKSGNSTKILYNDPQYQLTRFKYDFTPDIAILDGTDYAGAHALINNNISCKSIFYGRVYDKDNSAISKKCTYVICTEAFALNLAHVDGAQSASDFVNLYQKIVDISGSSNYIVLLNNHKILYSVDGKVKMLPEMKINALDYSSFDSIFTGAFAYCLANNIGMDDSIKFANTAAAISISRLGEVSAIPTIDEVLDNSGLREKLGLTQDQNNAPVQAQEVNPLQPNADLNSQTVNPINSDTSNTSATENVDAFNQSSQVVENIPTSEEIQNQNINTTTENTSENQSVLFPEVNSGIENQDNATSNMTSPIETNIYDEQNPI